MKSLNNIFIFVLIGAGANTLAMESWHGRIINPSSNPKKDHLWVQLLNAVQYGIFNEAPQTWITNRVNIPKDDGTTLRMIAARNGNVEVVHLLHLAGADVNIKNDNDLTALHCAASKGHTEIVKFLISKGAAIDVQNFNNWTPLHLATAEGHLPVVQTLLENGADINKQNINNDAALSFAAFRGQAEVVHFLIQNSADVFSQDNKALHNAAQQDKKACCELIVEAMLNQNAAHPAFFCLDQVGAKGDLYFDLKQEVCVRLDAYHTHEVREIVNSIDNPRVRKHLLEKFFIEPENK